MSLEIGMLLGPYKIESQAGAGGMGEVYKATDTRLDRTVAVKVLPTGFAMSTEVKQRFEREAKTISSLNHPNICTLFDVGEQDGIDYLVMEFIEGETLAEKLTKGPLELDELIKISVQITDALDKAHKQGLVHRDLKPGNVMLAKEGAKLLDFGLAKLAPDAGVPSNSAITHTTPLTGYGTIVGTMQYMAPEQLEGKDADARSDIFSFGIILYEMSTGVKAFTGDSQASLIASIMKENPRSVSELRPMIPPMLEQVISQCMSKDPEQRWQTAGDLKRSLMWVSEGGSQVGLPAIISKKRKSREMMAWSAAILLLIAASVSSFFLYQKISEPINVVKTHIYAPDNNKFASLAGGFFALSPDGQKLAFVANDTASNKIQLWVRPLNSLTPIPLPGTEDAQFPFWSPDGRYIAYFAKGKLKKVLAAGGPTLTLCDAQSGRKGSWNKNDVIIFTPTFNGSIHKVAAAGGVATPITTLDSTLKEVTHRWSTFLPDDNHFLFYSRTGSSTGSEDDAICIGSLESNEVVRLINARSTVAYANGYILYQRESSLMAHPFDPSSLKLTADAFPIAENVTFIDLWSRSVFTTSEKGDLVYRSGIVDEGSLLLKMNRSGIVTDTIGQLEKHYSGIFSPDEKFVATDILDAASSNTDVWIHDLARGIKNRFTFDEEMDASPIWSPDGETIAFSSERRKDFAGIYIKNISGLGSIDLLFESANSCWPYSFTPDGKYIVVGEEHPKTNDDIWIVPVDTSQEAFLFLNTNYFEYDPKFSPDGRWLAYASDESGKGEIYVTPFPGPGSKWQVSIDGGDRPDWRSDGRELYYLNDKDEIVSVMVDGSGSTFRAGKTDILFPTNPSRPGRIFDVSNDGQTFIVNTSPNVQSTSRVVLVKNWHEEIEF